MKIGVLGLWHLGCVTSACMADLGFFVTGYDFDENVVKDLQSGKPPLFEPGLEELIKHNMEQKRLIFHTDAKKAFGDIDYLWIAMDTPLDENDIADIEQLGDKVKKILAHLPNNVKIIISSQAPVGFTKTMESAFAKINPDKKGYFAHSPENLRLGNAIHIFKEPARIVIGLRDVNDKTHFLPLFSRISPNLEWMKIESSEMTKHAINTFLASSIVFANEIASLCESVDADAKEVERGLKTEERIGPKAFVSPGLAFAGGTLARDVNFLLAAADKHKKQIHLITAIKKSNDHHKQWIANKCEYLFPDLKNTKFGVLGLAYKANTSTLRRSTSIELCKWLSSKGAKVYGFDPNISELPAELEKIIELKKSIVEVVKSADCIILVNEHPLVKQTLLENAALLKNKVLIDPTRYVDAVIPIKEFAYINVGRHPAKK